MTQMMETPFGTPQPPAGDTPPPPRREPRRPGWTGVVAVGAAAALLSSMLTAGAVGAFGSDPVPVTAAPAPAVAGGAKAVTPVVTGASTTPNWVSVGSAVGPSVVSVQIEGAGGSGGEGSGVILDTAGRVLTNNHVVARDGSGGDISVVLSDGRSYPASIVGTDPSTDLAVLAMKNPPKDLSAATFGDSSAVKVGDPVMAIGNPLGLSHTVTTGIVSATDRPVTTSASTLQDAQDPFGRTQAQSEQVVTNAIQTDAAINPGNSGGALVDSAGRVVGITSTIASLGALGQAQAGSIGLGFAIPSNEAKDVASQLIADGSVEHAYLGVSLADDTVALDGAQRQAAVVGDLTAGAPAAKAGLKAGDAIIEVDGASLDGADSLVGRIRAMRPDTKVTLTIVRDGKRLTLTPTLAARPNSANG